MKGNFLTSLENRIEALENQIEVLEFYHQAGGRDFLAYEKGLYGYDGFQVKFVRCNKVIREQLPTCIKAVKINGDYLECWLSKEKNGKPLEVYCVGDKGWQSVPMELYLNKYYNDEEVEE